MARDFVQNWLEMDSIMWSLSCQSKTISTLTSQGQSHEVVVNYDIYSMLVCCGHDMRHELDIQVVLQRSDIK